MGLNVCLNLLAIANNMRALLNEVVATLTVGPFLRVQLQHTHFELQVSGDHLVQVDHKTMG